MIYVSEHGSDQTGDGSIDHPFKTRHRALLAIHEGISIIVGPSPQTLNESRKIYVAKSGSDFDGNGSKIAPFMTIKCALDCSFDGYTIIVAPGVYASEILTFKSRQLSRSAVIPLPLGMGSVNRRDVDVI